jgi:hypothetical protein
MLTCLELVKLWELDDMMGPRSAVAAVWGELGNGQLWLMASVWLKLSFQISNSTSPVDLGSHLGNLQVYQDSSTSQTPLLQTTFGIPPFDRS